MKRTGNSGGKPYEKPVKAGAQSEKHKGIVAM